MATEMLKSQVVELKELIVLLKSTDAQAQETIARLRIENGNLEEQLNKYSNLLDENHHLKIENQKLHTDLLLLQATHHGSTLSLEQLEAAAIGIKNAIEARKRENDNKLGRVFLREKGLIFNLVSFTSVPQTSRLMTTCKELYTAEKVVLQKLPKVCDMSSSSWRGDGNEFKLYGAIVVRVPNSRWLGWLNTSEVEELKLPRSVTDEEMLIMFGGERFSNLQTLGLTSCRNITDASVMEVARRCSNLQTLNLGWCGNITDASVLEVARRCSNLQTLDLRNCSNITSACKNALRQSHPKLELRR